MQRDPNAFERGRVFVEQWLALELEKEHANGRAIAIALRAQEGGTGALRCIRELVAFELNSEGAFDLEVEQGAS